MSDPPWRVFGEVDGTLCGPTWLIYYGYLWFNCSAATVASRNITVVDHPRNDPEAVEIIRKAKSETGK